MEDLNGFNGRHVLSLCWGWRGGEDRGGAMGRPTGGMALRTHNTDNATLKDEEASV